MVSKENLPASRILILIKICVQIFLTNWIQSLKILLVYILNIISFENISISKFYKIKQKLISHFTQNLKTKIFVHFNKRN